MQNRVCEDEDYLYFVHGASVVSGQTFGAIDPSKGGGDFGRGFYTFKLCDTDHETALKTAKDRARRKIKPRSPKGYGRTLNKSIQSQDGCLIFCRIPKTVFDTLRACDESDYGYRQGDRFYPTDCDVIAGLMQYGDGKERYFNLPKQYKFENMGITALEIVECDYSLE